jgi:hypothetical protein
MLPQLPAVSDHDFEMNQGSLLCKAVSIGLMQSRGSEAALAEDPDPHIFLGWAQGPKGLAPVLPCWCFAPGFNSICLANMKELGGTVASNGCRF